MPVVHVCSWYFYLLCLQTISHALHREVVSEVYFLVYKRSCKYDHSQILTQDIKSNFVLVCFGLVFFRFQANLTQARLLAGDLQPTSRIISAVFQHSSPQRQVPVPKQSTAQTRGPPKRTEDTEQTCPQKPSALACQEVRRASIILPTGQQAQQEEEDRQIPRTERNSRYFPPPETRFTGSNASSLLQAEDDRTRQSLGAATVIKKSPTVFALLEARLD